jgi:hypothetical protein
MLSQNNWNVKTILFCCFFTACLTYIEGITEQSRFTGQTRTMNRGRVHEVRVDAYAQSSRNGITPGIKKNEGFHEPLLNNNS